MNREFAHAISGNVCAQIRETPLVFQGSFFKDQSRSPGWQDLPKRNILLTSRLPC